MRSLGAARSSSDCAEFGVAKAGLEMIVATRTPKAIRCMTRPPLSSSLDVGVCRAEHARRTVLPNPGVDHPVCLGDEPPTVLPAFRILQMHSYAAIGQEADVAVLVPSGERSRKWRRHRL